MLVDRLRGETTVLTAELRPPRAELDAIEGMDAWIDTYHAIRRLSRQDVPVFLTDSAVGTQEENNLRHLIANLGGELPHEMVVPFLTSKHSLDFCSSYARAGASAGLRRWWFWAATRPWAGRDASSTRGIFGRRFDAHEPGLVLGGWANPHASVAQQVSFLLDDRFCAEFYLTQVVSHVDLDPVKCFLDEIDRRPVLIPGMFCVFYYRSAKPKTLEVLGTFMPVPVQGLIEEFAEVRRRWRCVRALFARCGRSACVTSVSAICRCTTRRRRSPPLRARI